MVHSAVGHSAVHSAAVPSAVAPSVAAHSLVHSRVHLAAVRPTAAHFFAAAAAEIVEAVVHRAHPGPWHERGHELAPKPPSQGAAVAHVGEAEAPLASKEGEVAADAGHPSILASTGPATCR